MAIDAYMWFQNYDGTYLDSESQVDFSAERQLSAIDFPPNDNLFEIDTYSLGIAQVLSIGSQSAGVGAGKVTFDPLSITRKTDRASPVLYQMACAGTPFESVALVLCKSAGGAIAKFHSPQLFKPSKTRLQLERLHWTPQCRNRQLSTSIVR